ncbi:MAG: hypothetical protein ACK49V_02860, partial [Actinomycetes bacterium]
KWATFLLMFTFPGFVMGESALGIRAFFEAFAWVAGPVGLALSYYTAIAYIPTIRRSMQKSDGVRDPHDPTAAEE